MLNWLRSVKLCQKFSRYGEEPVQWCKVRKCHLKKPKGSLTYFYRPCANPFELLIFMNILQFCAMCHSADIRGIEKIMLWNHAAIYWFKSNFVPFDFLNVKEQIRITNKVFMKTGKCRKSAHNQWAGMAMDL